MKKIFKEPQARLLDASAIFTDPTVQSTSQYANPNEGGLAPGRAGAAAPAAGAQGPKFE